jgi:hypothetical protein
VTGATWFQGPHAELHAAFFMDRSGIKIQKTHRSCVDFRPVYP